MKLRLTEEQYKRILTEDDNLKVTRPIRKMFELLDRNWDKLGTKKIDDVIKMISQHLGTSEDESYMIYKNFMSYRLDLIEGDPLQYYEMPVYRIRSIMPTVVSARTYLPGFIEVKATSEENALNKALDGEYEDMYLDDESLEWDDPDLDYDLYGDTDIMDDMVIDHLYDDSEEWLMNNELEDFVKLKK